MDDVPSGGFVDAVNLFQDSPDTTEDRVGYLTLFIWLYAFFCLYLYMRQQTVFHEWENRLPDRVAKYFPQEYFERSRQYELEKDNFDIISKFYKTILLTYLLETGGFHQMWVATESIFDFTSKEGESSRPTEIHAWRSAIFAFFLILVYFICILPLQFYFNFVIEESYGFNQQTLGFFALDTIKRFAITEAFFCPIAYMIRSPEEVGESNRTTESQDSVASWVVSVFLGYLTIEASYLIIDRLILPIFLTYTELPPGYLRERCEAVAASVSFPPSHVTVIDTSKYSRHANSVFYGFILNKRIFLFDMLQKSPLLPLTDDEVVGVLAHELGHRGCYHSVKKMIADNIYGAVVFWMFSYFWERHFSDSEIVMVIKMLPFMMRLIGSGGFFINYLATRYEFDADRYAVLECGKGVELRAALIKLCKQNLAFTVWDDLYSAWYHTQPSVMERLERIEEMLEEQQKKME